MSSKDNQKRFDVKSKFLVFRLAILYLLVIIVEVYTKHVLECSVYYRPPSSENHWDHWTYSCEVKNLKLTADDRTISRVTQVKFNDTRMPFKLQTKFYDLDLQKYPKERLKRLEIEESNCPRLPLALDEFFPNLKALRVHNTNLMKLTKEDLKPLSGLLSIIITHTKLESLDADLFEDLKNLQWIDFSDNKFKKIAPNILNPVKNQIMIISFKSSGCIDYSAALNQIENTTDLSAKFNSSDEKVKKLNNIENLFKTNCGEPKPKSWWEKFIDFIF